MKTLKKALIGLVVVGAIAAASVVVPDFEIREKAAAACDIPTGVDC